MKRTYITLLIAFLGFVFLLPQVASAIDVTVSAQVPTNSPSVSITIKQLSTPGQDPNTGTTVTAMNFGQLTHILSTGAEAGVWFSPNYFCVFIFTNSFGQKYEIRSSCAGLVSGAVSLPTGGFGITPGYASADSFTADGKTPQGTQPSGSLLGPAGPAITGGGAFDSVYTSEPAASNRILRAFYSIPSFGAGGALPFPGFTGVPLNQPAGTYTGTVTITIAAI